VVPGELPAHRFSPRPISGHTYPAVEAASMSSLPALKTGGKCVAAGAVPEGKPRPVVAVAKTKPKPSSPKRSAKSSAGYVPYADEEAKSADGTRPTGTSVAGNAASPPPAAEPSAAPDDDMAPSASGGDFADEVSAAPSTAVEKRDRKAKRNARTSRREANKQGRKNKDRASEASAPVAFDSPGMAESESDALAMEDESQAFVAEPEWPPVEEGWGEATYLSNDDTMSLSSAQRVAFAIDKFEPIAPQDVRPHELLNYFSFRTAPVDPGHDFSVQAEIAPSRRSPGLFTLGLAVAARPIGREGRRNAVVTLVVDRSGSMAAEGRMEYLKRGLLRMVRELKTGDIVHLVTFDHRVCTPLSNFVMGRDDTSVLIKAIHAIKPSGSTNLHAGLTQGYTLADNTYQPKYTNRVVMITDALANRGVTDPRTMSMVSDFYDARRIRLSGIGVGRTFNDELLDGLTEAGRGAYVFLGSEQEVDAVFGDRFTSLIETAANDTHFRLHLPPSLRIEQFHGEESSTVKRDVQAVHFFADTSQLFLADLEPWEGQLRPQDDVMLEIEYQHPETGETMVEEYAFNLGAISESRTNVHKAEVVMHFIEGIGRQARRGVPSQWSARAGAWRDADALEDCATTRRELAGLSEGQRDREVERVVSLWDGYCARFEGQATGRPGRKDAGGDRWPSAGAR
jgi:Ca-activated chloride channel family protein